MQQRKILFGSMLIIMTLLIRGKAQEHQDAVDEYNVPKEIEVCLKSRPDLKISGQINPFYLSGDFDGDGKLDFAVQIDHSGKHGVAICLSSQKKPLVVGAGSP